MHRFTQSDEEATVLDELAIQVITDRAIGCCSPSEKDAKELLSDLADAGLRIVGAEPAAYVYAHKTKDEGFMQPNKANMDQRHWDEIPLYRA